MNDLNRKLAEWAGFLRQELKELPPAERHPANLGWWIPRSEKSTKVLPDFSFLDEIFKHLIPKVLEQGYTVTIYISPIFVCSGRQEKSRVEVNGTYTQRNDNDYKEYANHGEEALALCKAIERLLDNE